MRFDKQQVGGILEKVGRALRGGKGTGPSGRAYDGQVNREGRTGGGGDLASMARRFLKR
jgi:hypothetical protein